MASASKPAELRVEYTITQKNQLCAATSIAGPVRSTKITSNAALVEHFWQKARKRILQSSDFVQWSRHSDKKTPDASQVALDFENLERLVQDSIVEAEEQRDKHHRDASSVKAMGRATTKFLVDFQAYCQALSGIAHLTEGLSHGASIAAVDVLSVFMMFAVSKHEIEGKLDTMIDALKKEYERIGRLEPVYTGANMHERVTTVYDLGILILKEATVYYSYGSRRRLWYVLRRPPSIDLDNRLSEIKSAIGELVQERDTLDRERLNRVENKMDIHLYDALADRASARLVQIAPILGIPYGNALNELQSYKCLLEDTFSRIRRLPPLDEQGLFRSVQYVGWEGESSSYLLLHGQTVAPHNTSLSWISQAAVATALRLLERGATVVWAFCRQDDRGESDIWGRRDPRLAAPLALVSLGHRLLNTTSIGRHATATCSASEFDGILDLARVTKDLFAAYEKSEQQPRLMQCTEAAIAFLRGCVTLVHGNGMSDNPQKMQSPIHFVADRFDVLPLLDTAFLKPLMRLNDQDETGIILKILVVGERKLRDQKGGDSVADFIDDHLGKVGFGVLELSQMS